MYFMKICGGRSCAPWGCSALNRLTPQIQTNITILAEQMNASNHDAQGTCLWMNYISNQLHALKLFTDEPVEFAKSLCGRRKRMKPTHLETNKLDFFCIFDEAFDSEQIFQVGKHERVEVKIHSVRFDELDRHILITILNEGKKYIGYDEVNCRMPVHILMKLIGLHETVLYERIRKYLSLWVETYTNLADSECSLCSIQTLSENGKRVAFELTFYHINFLLKYFNEDFTEILMKGIEAGPLGAH